MKNAELLDLVKSKLEIATDRELAALLGIAPSHLSAYVNDKRPMPTPMKFRLLDHVGFSSETRRFAACFVDINEHQIGMQEDLDRLEELRRQKAGKPTSHAQLQWIERLSDFQAKNNLSDAQLATSLGIGESVLEKIKSGDMELPKSSKSLLLKQTTSQNSPAALRK